MAYAAQNARQREATVVVLWIAAALAFVVLAGRLALEPPQSSAGTNPANVRKPQVAQSPRIVERTIVLSDDDWMNNLRSESFWKSGKAVGSSTAKGKATPTAVAPPPLWGLFGPQNDPLQPLPLQVVPRGRQQSSGYRTVCFRLCDGYFFPISFSTTRERFGDDEETCQSRCGAPARLFVYRNPGEEPENMIDLNGQPYSKLKTAFLFRTTYDASCKCNPHPWEQEARLKHRIYALEAERGKGNRKAAAELKDLKAVAANDARAQREAAVALAAAATGSAGLAAKGNKPVPAPVTAALSDDEIDDDTKAKSRSRSGGQKLAASDKPLPKGAMRLGAANGPSTPVASPRGGDWKKSVFSVHN